jgi:hypothetical protein
MTAKNPVAKTPDQEKIVDKIRKLLKHAADSAEGAEHERDNALRMAMKLMAKYNLHDVKMEEDKEDRDETVDEHFPDPFRRIIANAIAEMFFCKFYSNNVPGKQKKNFHFVGLESNAITAKEMAAFVIKSICDESGRVQREHMGSHGFGTTFRNAAATRIAERCRAIRAEEEKAQAQEVAPTGSKSTAVTLAGFYETELAANEAYIKNILGIQLRKGKATMSNKSSHASQLGRAFGDKINLGPQVGGGSKKSAGSLK